MKYIDHHKASGIEVGDMVKVVRAPKTGDPEGWDNSWVKDMDKAVGKTFEVIFDRGVEGFELKDGAVGGIAKYDYPSFCLEKVVQKFSIGDKVKITRKFTKEDFYWTMDMDECLGRVGRVTDVGEHFPSYKVEVEGRYFCSWYLAESLELVEAAETPKKIVVVDCEEFSVGASRLYLEKPWYLSAPPLAELKDAPCIFVITVDGKEYLLNFKGVELTESTFPDSQTFTLK